MKKFSLFILLIIIFGCNSKEDHYSPRLKNASSGAAVPQKITGEKLVAELDKLGYFNLTKKKELNTVKASYLNGYTDLYFFRGPTRGETLTFMDNRFQWIDCEELFEIDGLIKYLKQLQPTFEQLGLELEFGNEQSEQDQHRWKHTIELNEIEYTAFDEQFSDLDWRIAYVNFLEMLNAELRRQNSEEQFYPINCGNDGMFVLLTQKQFEHVHRYYPKDDEHPTTMSNWKNKNGI